MIQLARLNLKYHICALVQSFKRFNVACDLVHDIDREVLFVVISLRSFFFNIAISVFQFLIIPSVSSCFTYKCS